MSDHSDEAAEVKALEASLAALRPLDTALSRDDLMFRAGQASARRRPFWLLATVAAMLLAVVQGWWLRTASPPLPDVRYVYYPIVQLTPAVEVISAVIPDEGPITKKSRIEYFQLCDEVLERGLDGLPPSQASPQGKTLTMESLLQSL